MIYTYPHYYDKFKCIAADCQDTCCAGWQIVIDETSIEAYGQYAGSYKQTLHKGINWKEEVFRQDKQRRCAFLRDDLLCDMYACMGEGALCKTCKEYPRHTEEYENLREVTLSLSCPTAARLILANEDKVSFYSVEDKEDETFDDFDYFLFSTLEDMRADIVSILQDRGKSIRQRVSKILILGAAAQRHYDEGDLIDYQELSIEDELGDIDEYELLKDQFSWLYELEVLNPQWVQLLTESEELLFDGGATSFAYNNDRFIEYMNRADLPQLEVLLEQLLVYFITTYFLGAVYDENIVGKVDSAVAHVTMIYLLMLARWLKNEEYLDMEDIVEVSYRYSREIEHSDENVEEAELIDWFRRRD